MKKSPYKLVRLDRSPKADKKFVATFRHKETGREKQTHFGHAGSEDYTMHKDKGRRAAYRERHERDLRTGDPTRAGFLSYYVLWGDSTSLTRNLAAFRRRFF